jgi:hypothetical protein
MMLSYTDAKPIVKRQDHEDLGGIKCSIVENPVSIMKIKLKTAEKYAILAWPGKGSIIRSEFVAFIPYPFRAHLPP